MPAPAADAPAVPSRTLYETDFYAWARGQAAALRRGDLAAVDWDNVIEEIEELSRSRERKWRSLAAQSVQHMLAIEHFDRAEDRTVEKWKWEVREVREQMARVLRRNAGLKGKLARLLAEAWEDGRSDAVRRLARYDADAGRGRMKDLYRKWRGLLPGENPWSLREAVGYDPRTERAPDPDAWPPGVAARLDCAARRARFRPRRER